MQSSEQLNRLNSQQVRAFSASSRTDAPKEGALLEEFSRLLDKIAVQLNENQELSSFHLEKTEPVKAKPKPEPEAKTSEKPEPEPEVKAEPEPAQTEPTPKEDIKTDETRGEFVKETESKESGEDETAAKESEEVEAAAQPETEGEPVREMVASAPAEVSDVVEAAVKEVLHPNLKPATTEVPKEVVKDHAEKPPVDQKVLEAVSQEPSPKQQQDTALQNKVGDVIKQALEGLREEVKKQPSEQKLANLVQQAVRDLPKEVKAEVPADNLAEVFGQAVRNMLQETKAVQTNIGFAQNGLGSGNNSPSGLQRSLGLQLGLQAGLSQGLDISSAANGKSTAQTILNAHHDVSFNRQTGKGGELLEAKKEQPLTRSQQLRTLEKVEEALKEVARSKDGKTLSFRLDPPKLGHVRVDVSLRDGILHARVAADSAQVNSLLRDKAFEMQRTLREMGLDVDQVSVSVRDESGSQQYEWTNSNRSGRDASDLNLDFSFGDAPAEVVSQNNTPSTDIDHWVA